ncbi:MAG: selenide, water dikinase SelD [Bacteroidales bacterium]
MKTDLLKFTDQGGCSSKIPPAQLEEILSHLPVAVDPDILVNIDTHDDAGVYRINDDLALVITTDFFPPMVSDPYEFGEIAAANAISDVYAMGGTPVLGLNIMMFPASKLPMEAYAEILKGGYAKASEAGVKIIGGHTIDDPVPKYGLAVTGFVHPNKLVTNRGAEPGDLLILTKPVGTGIIMAGHSLGMASDKDLEEAKNNMKQLNMKGAAIMQKYNIKGATDITGFGLAGHALKMARGSNVSMTLNMRSVPLIGITLSLVDEGCIPGACFTNLDYTEKDLSVSDSLGYNHKMIAFDAQTSGGLLISAPPGIADKILTDFRNEGFPYSTIVGEVTEHREKLLFLE